MSFFEISLEEIAVLTPKQRLTVTDPLCDGCRTSDDSVDENLN